MDGSEGRPLQSPKGSRVPAPTTLHIRTRPPSHTTPLRRIVFTAVVRFADGYAGLQAERRRTDGGRGERRRGHDRRKFLVKLQRHARGYRAHISVSNHNGRVSEPHVDDFVVRNNNAVRFAPAEYECVHRVRSGSGENR